MKKIAKWGTEVPIEFTGAAKRYTPPCDGVVIVIARNANNASVNGVYIYDISQSSYLAFSNHTGANEYTTVISPVHGGVELQLLATNAQSSGTSARFIPLQ